MSPLASLNDGYRALVIGASGGIGGAFAACLANDPKCSDLVRLSRRHDGLDVTDEPSVARHAALLAGREFDVMICATGALVIDQAGPEKTIRNIDTTAMARQFALNAIGPALVLKHFSPRLPRRTRSLVGVLSARVGSIGDNRLGGWISYRAAKAALNQIIRTAAIEIARSRPESVVVALHPGTVATSLSSAYSPGHPKLAPDQAAASMLTVLDGLAPAQTGCFRAYDGSEVEW